MALVLITVGVVSHLIALHVQVNRGGAVERREEAGVLERSLLGDGKGSLVSGLSAAHAVHGGRRGIDNGAKGREKSNGRNGTHCGCGIIFFVKGG